MVNAASIENATFTQDMKNKIVLSTEEFLAKRLKYDLSGSENYTLVRLFVCDCLFVIAPSEYVGMWI